MSLSALLVLISCSKEPTVIEKPVLQTKLIERTIPKANRPRSVDLIAPEFYVVNRDNFDEFIARFTAKNGTETFVVISVEDYENLAISLAELRRYIEQQNEVIVYYETQVSQ